MISRFQFSQFICDCSTQWTVRTSDVILYFVLVLKPLGCSAAVSSLNNKNASKVSPLLPSLHLHRLHRQHIIMDLRRCTNISCTSDLRRLPQVLCSRSPFHGGARVLFEFFSFFVCSGKDKSICIWETGLPPWQTEATTRRRYSSSLFFFFQLVPIRFPLRLLQLIDSFQHRGWCVYSVGNEIKVFLRFNRHQYSWAGKFCASLLH